MTDCFEQLKLAHVALEHAHNFIANLVCVDDEQLQWANAVQEHIQKARYQTTVEAPSPTPEKGACDWYDGMGVEG